MRIDSASIGMDSARSYHASKTSVRRFEITDYQAALTDVSTKEQKTPEEGDTAQNTGEQENSAENTAMTAKDWQSRFLVSSARWDMRSSASEQTLSTIREYTVRYIFDLLFPSRNSTLRDWMQENGWNAGNSVDNARTNSGSTQGTAAPASDTFYPVAARMKVLNYVGETYNVEQEDTSFSTVGTVRTKDGREINFNVNVNMSRRCEEYYREELNVAQFALYDPLVINLNTDVTELSDQTFYFDLDADGEEEEISMLKGSGYLALDKNGDGVINDGSELFGTKNGDGFADLARYDEDGNGWIDENDSIWSKLKIWCKDENGNDVLYKLSDQGVGAICLENVSTDFTMQGDRKAQDGTMNANATNAVIRKTGIFLYENGNVGTVQHVDMAAYAAKA
uniref:hypothetical protein n=1 Tax=Acetatifactor sp. TaxID=1872090 RepID=UPI004028984F